MKNTIEPRTARLPGRHRLAPAVIVFFVAAAGVYFTAFLALSVLRHIVMPVLAVAVGAYLATVAYRLSGRNSKE